MKYLTTTPRLLWLTLAAVSVLGMAFAFYLQYVEGLAPCPLCMTQRIFLVAVGVVALIAAAHNPGKAGLRLYAAGAFLFTALGAAFAGRHVWLQHLPEDQVPACGPSLEYLIDTLPLRDALSVLLMGDGNCAEVVWQFLGFSIPELTLAVFIAIAIAILRIAVLSVSTLHGQ